MEKINCSNFEEKCPLLKMGFSITGQGRQGIIMENSGVPAAPILLFVCGGCPYRGNGCEPSMPTDIKNEIDAKVES